MAIIAYCAEFLHLWMTSIVGGVPVYGVLTRVTHDCTGGDKYPERCACIRGPKTPNA